MGDAGIKNLKYCLFLVISEAPTDTKIGEYCPSRIAVI